MFYKFLMALVVLYDLLDAPVLQACASCYAPQENTFWAYWGATVLMSLAPILITLVFIGLLRRYFQES